MLVTLSEVEELGAISCYPLVSFHPQKADKKDTASIRARALVFIIKNINPIIRIVCHLDGGEITLETPHSISPIFVDLRV